jgi:DNA topoisomerase-3
MVRFDENFKLKLEPKKIAAPTPPKKTKPRPNLYPVLNVKRNSNQRKYAYGCSHYKTGCDFKVTFDIVREKLKPKTHQRTSAQYFERKS